MRLATQFYINAYCKLSDEPEWHEEIMHVKLTLDRPLSELTPQTFFEQYAYVVLCSYWKEQYARKEWDKFFETGDLNAISNRRKRDAINFGITQHKRWLEELKEAEDKIKYLGS